MPEQDNPSTPDCASQSTEIAAPAQPVAKLSVYHRDVAVEHFGVKLGACYQTTLLLAHMWLCVRDPWELEPTVHLASSRLEWIAADRANRGRVISKLVKLGAVKKGRATRAGCQYTLLRPSINKLSVKLQDELANMSTRDYRYNAGAPMLEGLQASTRSKPVRVKGLPRVARAQLEESNTALGLDWKKLAALLEKIAGLSKSSLRYHPPAKEVAAFSGWLRKFKIQRSELAVLCRLVKNSERPEGLALRYVFEVDTLQKRAYMDAVFAKLRPALTKVTETPTQISKVPT